MPRILVWKGYDSDALVESLRETGVSPVIPHVEAGEVRGLTKNLNRLGHLIENTFLERKHWRGVLTRYAKVSTSFLAAVSSRYAAIWA